MKCYLEREGFRMMYYDYNKRSYLLPSGCKDLIDLLRLEQEKKQLPMKLPMMQAGLGFIPGTGELIGPWKLKKSKPKEPETGSAETGTSTREVSIPETIVVMA